MHVYDMQRDTESPLFIQLHHTISEHPPNGVLENLVVLAFGTCWDGTELFLFLGMGQTVFVYRDGTNPIFFFFIQRLKRD